MNSPKVQEEPDPLTESDIVKALTPIPGNGNPIAERLASALSVALQSQNLDLRVVPDEDFAYEDTVARSRQVYVMSLLKLVDFMRQPAANLSEKEVQAKLALAYIRHAEGDTKILSLGRAPSDQRLEQDVTTLRQEMAELAQMRHALSQPKNGKQPD